MRIKNYIALLIVIAVSSHGDAINVVADLPFPQRVLFGMNIAELEAVRPSILYDHDVDCLGKFGATEVVSMVGGIRSGYIYHFKDGILGAVVYARGSTNMMDDVETKKWYKALVDSGVKVASEQTARGGQVLNVKRWSIQEPKVDIYFTATSDSTGITFISPRYFVFEDFFPAASEAKRQTENRKRSNLAAGRKEVKVAVIDRLSTNAPPDAALTGE